jgi:murein DD-endopeptidase MepM/ murein hydrolase activator NlpD
MKTPAPLSSALAATTLAILLGLPVATKAAPCPSVLPVMGEKSSVFGAPRGSRGHSGSDIRAPMGTPVRLAAGGVVTHAGPFFAYGLMVEVEHPDGSRARYAHLARIERGVSAGAALRPGHLIGTVGRTGRTTGPNLHVELRRDGRAVDPWPWLTRGACTPLIEVAEAPER